MKNFILAITSFIATVILLSQVALAQSSDAEGWDPKHTIAATSEDPNDKRNTTNKPEGGSRSAGDDCDNCAKHEVNVKLTENTNPRAGSSGSTSGGNRSSETGSK